MSKGLKVVTIGGGSSYTPELVEGFIKRYTSLPVRELWLVDIPEGEEKLKIVGNLAKRMVKKAGVPMEIHLTLNRKEALKEADFVTTQIRVGQLPARILDESIPLKYGLLGQETNGVGGFFKGLRTIPVLLDICQEMTELCPDAWLINFTNPAGMVTEALLRYAKHKKVIGLCNVPFSMTQNLAKLLHVEAHRIHIDFAGLNHMVFGLRAYLDGKDISQELLKQIARENSSIHIKNIPEFNWEPQFIQALGVIPCPYHRYYYKTKEMLADQLQQFQKEGKTRAHHVYEVEKELFALYQDPNLQEKPKQLEQRGGAYYSDAACNLIDAIYNDKKNIQTVNVENRGSIANLPYHSAVEVNCLITKDGPKPIAMGELPTSVIGLVQQIKSFEVITSEAAISGDYNQALLALTINPLVSSDETAKKVLDEMLEAHRAYLPQFF
ncbi:6-phospho-beta-glucosidase [Thermoflavimicrobium daqui]|uniref:6-phospho-beta-glucosidase n=1 Tax=Thermoflavimicrobium daqui TaxID=2137476 RepID=A0A364K832_9BACL|nr:6-phospho-beta-glucosidase [Thermoflavimicrobium daqui]RAL26447.1 6-phospho-beta-glucosidase [Thermoflavimicrobium daqui]